VYVLNGLHNLIVHQKQSGRTYKRATCRCSHQA